ncbi:MAG TPA: hypothetical protein VFQ59_01700 [Candidatus Paceibacterota bacterium]|nr:hypothetical protein [Candidatus Paceibacterota bacterium]
MNKKYLSILIIAGVILGANAGIASANIGTGVNTDASLKLKTAPIRAELKMDAEARVDLNADLKTRREAVNAELQVKREGLRKEMEVRKAEMATQKADVNTEVKNARVEFTNRIAMSFGKITENLAQISARVNSRIEKMKADGADVAVAEELMLKAETSLAQSIDLATIAKAKLDAGADTAEIKAAAEAARDALKEAHKYMREAVKSLKDNIKTNREVEVKSKIDLNLKKVAE